MSRKSRTRRLLMPSAFKAVTRHRLRSRLHLEIPHAM
jgi:hypothetical protein